MKNKVYYLGVATTVFILIIGICAYSLALLKHKEKYAETESEAASAAEYVPGKDTDGDPAGDDLYSKRDTSGDIPDIDTSPNKDFLDTQGKPPTQKTMAELAAKYNKAIPYCLNGTDEYMCFEYIKAPDGVNNLTLGTLSHGMTSLSYIKWLYRNTLGFYPEVLDDEKQLSNAPKTFGAKDLKAGDIGIYKDPETGSCCFGVCVGFYENCPMFSYCSSIPTKDIPGGTNHISYLKSIRNEYFNGSPAVDFSVYVRPDIIWNGE